MTPSLAHLLTYFNSQISQLSTEEGLCLPLTCAPSALLWQPALLHYLLLTEESSASRLLTMHHSTVLHNKRIYILKYSAGEWLSLVAMAMCRHSLQDAARTHVRTVKANGHGQKAILMRRGNFNMKRTLEQMLKHFIFEPLWALSVTAPAWAYNSHDILSGF